MGINCHGRYLRVSGKKKEKFAMKTVKQYNRLLGEAAKPPSLEVFKPNQIKP